MSRFIVASFVAGGVALGSTAGAATLVVLNKAEATASLIDLDSGRVVATVPTGQSPHEVSVSPDGRLALATNYGTREAPGSTLTLIDVPAAKVVRTIDLKTYQRPHGVRWLDDRKALVTSEASQSLLVVDTPEGKVLSAIPTGQEVSHMVAVARDRAFVANIGSGTVTVIDLKAGRPTKQIATGAGAEGIDVTPDGTQVWVTNREADTVSVIDASRLEVVARLPSASFPIRAKATPDGRHVLVSNAKTGDVAVFSVADRKEERRIALKVPMRKSEGRLMQFGDSSVPIGIVVEPGGARAYVAHANADEISIVDLAKWQVVGSLRAGQEPDGMALSSRNVGR